jgi:uncharacterized Zn-binding protein involved in type VI secretion
MSIVHNKSSAPAAPHAARLHDRHRCPKDGHDLGKLHEACGTVAIEGALAARVVDRALCRESDHANFVTKGAPHVLIQGRRAARIGDPMAHGGQIISGASHVLIGNYTKRPEPPKHEGHMLAFELTGSEKDILHAAFVYTESDGG